VSLIKSFLDKLASLMGRGLLAIIETLAMTIFVILAFVSPFFFDNWAFGISAFFFFLILAYLVLKVIPQNAD
jgi:hypothetical protein